MQPPVATLGKLSVSFETVTPELAYEWLKKNPHNRHMRQDVITSYARDIKTGNWHTTHQGIAFNEAQARLSKRIQLIVWREQSDPQFHAKLIGTNFKASSTVTMDSAVANLALRLWVGHNKRGQFNERERQIADGILARAIGLNQWEATRA
jgi:hypothetical protein